MTILAKSRFSYFIKRPILTLIQGFRCMQTCIPFSYPQFKFLNKLYELIDSAFSLIRILTFLARKHIGLPIYFPGQDRVCELAGAHIKDRVTR